VTAENNSAENVYIQSATLDGHPLDASVIRWEDIMAGASLKVVMGPSPSHRAADWKPVPLSESLSQ
jgi:putative alpha-1,2-mannosidase